MAREFDIERLSLEIHDEIIKANNKWADFET